MNQMPAVPPLAGADEHTQTVIYSYLRCLPEAAWRSALEQLAEQQPMLEARYLTKTLQGMIDEGRYR